jgi:hypothetical protein
VSRLPATLLTIFCVAICSVELTGCDPCFGTLSGCESEPRLSLQGRIVDDLTGHSIDNAVVSIVVTTNGAGVRDSAFTSTDEHGFFEFSLDASAAGEMTFDVEVAPADGPSYRVRDLKADATTRRGEGHNLGLWVARPYFDVIGEFAPRCQPGEKFGDTQVTFIRTGGVAVEGLPPGDSVTHTTNANGQVSFFSRDVRPAGLDPMLGIFRLNRGGVIWETGASVTPQYLYRDIRVILALLGPEGTYVGCIYDRSSVVPVAGIQIDFTRTAGVATATNSISTVTDSDGRFALMLQPSSAASVVGDLTIHSPSPSSTYVKRGVVLDHIADPLGRAAPHFGVGLHLPYYGFVKRGADPVGNTQIIVKRVGGITVVSDSISTVTDGNGVFLLYPFLKPTSAGDLIADITIIPPAPDRSFVLRSFHIPTVDEDSDARVLLDLDLAKANGEPAGPGSAQPSRNP